MNLPSHIFDSSAWVGAWNELYSPRVFPRVWPRFKTAVESGEIGSPRRVIDEIAAKDDELKQWMKPHRKALEGALLAHNRQAEVEAEVARLRNDYPKLRTRNGADYYVIAWAKALGIPLVGTENPRATESRKAMAGVCRREEVAYQSPLQFMLAKGWKFP